MAAHTVLPLASAKVVPTLPIPYRYLCLPLTIPGAAMDPLGPTSGAIFGRDTNSHLFSIHWVGGLIGGAIAGWIWRNVLGRE